MNDRTPDDIRERRRTILRETSAAAVYAHEADLREATDSVEWERAGFLRTLRRKERRAA